MSRNLARSGVTAAVALALLLPLPAAGQTEVLHLAVGDPERREREVPLVLDAVTDARTGELLAPAELAALLRRERAAPPAADPAPAADHQDPPAHPPAATGPEG